MAPSHLRFTFYSQNLFSRWIAVTALLATIFIAPIAKAQTTTPHASKAQSGSGMDVSLGIFGQLTPAQTPTEFHTDQTGTLITQTIQGTSTSVGVLGTFHQSFKPWLGYSVNLGYSRFAENYSQGMEFIPNPKYVPTLYPTSSYARGSIGTNMYELTGAYLVRGPKVKRLDTFAQLGGGVLSFLPTQDPSPYSVQFRPTMVFGAGVNYKLSKHWALRAEYRGLFLKSPNFNGETAAGSVPTSKLLTVTNEPTLSIVYRFGGKR